MASLNIKVIINLYKTLNIFDRATIKLLIDFDLSIGQFSVLETLLHQGDMCVGEAQERVLTTSGNIALIIKNLEARGLITKQTHPDDKRKSILSLSNAGKELIKRAFPVNEAMIDKKLDFLDESEKKALIATLKKIIKANKA